MPDETQTPSERDGRYLPYMAINREGLDPADSKKSKRRDLYKTKADRVTRNRVERADLDLLSEGRVHGLNPQALAARERADSKQAQEVAEHNRIFDMAKRKLVAEIGYLTDDLRSYDRKSSENKSSQFNNMSLERGKIIAGALEDAVRNIMLVVEEELGELSNASVFRIALRGLIEQSGDAQEFANKAEKLATSLGTRDRLFRSDRYRVFSLWSRQPDLVENYYRTKKIQDREAEKEQSSFSGVEWDEHKIDEFIQRYNSILREARDVNIQTKNRSGAERNFFLQDEIAKQFKYQLSYKLMGSKLASVIIQRI